jgi:hypothetical protein
VAEHIAWAGVSSGSDADLCAVTLHGDASPGGPLPDSLRKYHAEAPPLPHQPCDWPVSWGKPSLGECMGTERPCEYGDCATIVRAYPKGSGRLPYLGIESDSPVGVARTPCRDRLPRPAAPPAHPYPSCAPPLASNCGNLGIAADFFDHTHMLMWGERSSLPSDGLRPRVIDPPTAGTDEATLARPLMHVAGPGARALQMKRRRIRFVRGPWASSWAPWARKGRLRSTGTCADPFGRGWEQMNPGAQNGTQTREMASGQGGFAHPTSSHSPAC